jgi:hypothetical protein
MFRAPSRTEATTTKGKSYIARTAPCPEESLLIPLVFICILTEYNSVGIFKIWRRR